MNIVVRVVFSYVKDVLNHVIDDLEHFMRTLFEMTSARKEMEKKSTKSPRKKSEGTKWTIPYVTVCVFSVNSCFEKEGTDAS